LPKFLINWQNQLITLLNYPALLLRNNYLCQSAVSKSSIARWCCEI